MKGNKRLKFKAWSLVSYSTPPLILLQTWLHVCSLTTESSSCFFIDFCTVQPSYSISLLLDSSTDPSANFGHCHWLVCQRCCNSTALLLGVGTSDSCEYNWSHSPRHHLRWTHLTLLHPERGTKSNSPLQKYLINKLRKGVKTAQCSLAVPSKHLRQTRALTTPHCLGFVYTPISRACFFQLNLH